MSLTRKSLKTNSLIFAVGFTAIIGQLVFIRLTAQSFNGNELTMCVAIGHWLLWTGIGSLIGSRIAPNRLEEKKLFTLIVLYSVLLIGAANLLMLIRQLIGVNLSEMLGLGRIFLWTGLLFILPSLINGLFFPLLVNWVSWQNIENPIHKVYITETIGSATGGMVFIAMILIGVSTVNMLNLITAILIVTAGFVFIEKSLYKLIIAIISIFLFVVLAQFISPKISSIRWSPYRIIEIRESPHQAIAALSYDENVILFSNNEPLWSFGIEENAEELVHFGMLNHPAPHHVLIIGPVYEDLITQLGKYPSTETITSVQSDKVLSDLLDKYTGPESIGKIEIRRIIDDPLKFLRQSTLCFDVMILNIPLPLNAMWNVYYSTEFFTLLKNHLNDMAVVAMQFPGSETYLNNNQLQFLKVMENTVGSVFTHIAWIPGETVHLIASDQRLESSFEHIAFELKYRGIDNRYIRDNYLWDRLSPMKIDFLNDQLARCDTKRINSIVKPIGFYFNTVLWDQQTGGLLKKIYPWFAGKSPVLFGAMITGIILLMLLIFHRNKRYAAVSKLNMAMVGFSIMSLESVVLITLQSFAGSLYLRVALLSMSFMVGAAGGAAWQRRYHDKSKRLQLYFVLSALLLTTLIYGLLLNSGSYLLNYPGLHYSVLFLGGFTGGLIFPTLSQRV
ncbi:MAG: hypothetical protein Q7J65_08385, partial [Candidatus Marinimicrobia bacterium]|nr:hypothetical protein [Candidatus Neomarinimicrobiota bacterium]